jgi:hypothetical protein
LTSGGAPREDTAAAFLRSGRFAASAEGRPEINRIDRSQREGDRPVSESGRADGEGHQPGTAGELLTEPPSNRKNRLESDRLWRALIALAPAIIFSIGRVLNLGLLEWLAAKHDRDPLVELTSWDGLRFLAIAEHGYTWVTDARAPASPAFFPAYPWATSLVSNAFSVEIRTAAFLVSAAGGLVTAYGLVALAALVPSLKRQHGLILVAIFSIAPMSLVLSMAYTEALYCAFAVWSLVFLLRRQWIIAGVLCALAGLVRPSGIALVGAVILAGLVEVARKNSTWRTWVGMAAAPLGFFGYIIYVGVRLGDALAWFRLQRDGWDTQFDFGRATLDYFGRTAERVMSLLDVVTVALLLAAVALMYLSVRQRLPWVLSIYSALCLIQVLGTDGIMNSKGRLLIPAFTLLIPVAVRLTRESRAHKAAAIVLCALVSSWYSAYALVIYPFAI